MQSVNTHCTWRITPQQISSSEVHQHTLYHGVPHRSAIRQHNTTHGEPHTHTPKQHNPSTQYNTWRSAPKLNPSTQYSTWRIAMKCNPSTHTVHRESHQSAVLQHVRGNRKISKTYSTRLYTIMNDPSAGSPTETLLRLLLPLSDKV